MRHQQFQDSPCHGLAEGTATDGLVMLQETDEFGILFSEWVSFAGCSAWTLVWMLMHRVLPPKLDCERTDCPTKSMHTFYVRKLNRMFIYCLAASAAGLSIFSSCFFRPQPTEAMLMSFGPVQQFFFWMAVGHWVTALWEDWCTRHFLGQGLTVESGGGLALFPLNLCCTSAQVMYATYTAHHLVTIFAYIYALWTRELGGVMVQGLLFELPVVFMLRRELGHAQKVPPKWLQNPRRARSHWISTYLAFLVGRGPAECLWIVSMLDTPFGHPLLEESLSSASIVVYHTLAFFFTSLNVRILGLLFCWHWQDVSRATEHQKEQEQSQAADRPPKEVSKE